MAAVNFYYADVPSVSLQQKRLVKQFIVSIFQQERVPIKKLDYVFCSDEYLLSINRSFLQHDYYTDIITFNLSEASSVEGEVYISIDRVRENASEHRVSFRRELLRVMFHGVLHLCGYGDKKKREITIMRDKEEYYLRSFEEQNP